MTQDLSLAGQPKELIERPNRLWGSPCAGEDLLSDVLHTIRLSGSQQLSFMAAGSWWADEGPFENMIPFHVVLDGACWVRWQGRELGLKAGDVIAFPFGAFHQVGCGTDGKAINVLDGLPPLPWRKLPVVRYGAGSPQVHMLCGFLQCGTMSFRPLRSALPPLLHVRTRSEASSEWLRSTAGQMAAEVQRPRGGALTVLERLAEVMFIELVRHQIIATGPEANGWLAALADPPLARCLALIHENPGRDWSLQSLAAKSGLSRSRLSARFETVLGTSPMRYLRDWRLCLAGVDLTTTGKPIAVIAHEAGYGTEAAFNRAFSRAYGTPPAAWRQGVRPTAVADGNTALDA